MVVTRSHVFFIFKTIFSFSSFLSFLSLSLFLFFLAFTNIKAVFPRVEYLLRGSKTPFLLRCVRTLNRMATPVTITVPSYFFPIGNTPALCLTQDMVPEMPVSLLLLGCGDARNVLFTTYADANVKPRTLDFTCCDHEPAIFGICFSFPPSEFLAIIDLLLLIPY